MVLQGRGMVIAKTLSFFRPGFLEAQEPTRVPALFSWAQEEQSETIDASHVPRQAPELPLDDERILVLDGAPLPPDEFLGS